ncbi:MAG: SpoIIE family protein phosphatase [Chloroflexi bacterium]|nr:SpoIIE family protein phosphatase [Chloroflexota bacterium]
MLTQQALFTFATAAYLPLFLALLALNAWVFWRRYRSRQQLVEQVAELEELAQAGSALVAAQLDLAALCDLIVAQADRILETRTFQLGFFEGHYYHIQSWMIEGEVRPPRTVDLRDQNSLVGWVRDNKTNLLIADFLREQELPARPRYISDAAPRSGIYVPLISGDEVVAILAAQSNKPNQFNQRHLRLLSILANQAAAAIANGRLFAQTRQRAAQVELIGTITQQINAAENVEEVFQRVTDLTRETFGFYQVNIFTRQTQQAQLTLRASSDHTLPLDQIVFSYDQGLIGAAVSLQKTIVANHARDDERFTVAIGVPAADESWAVVQSAFITPLVVNHRVWGVLEVLSTAEEVFGSQEQEVLETLAAGVSISLQKAQQLMHQRLQAWVTTARLQIASAIARSTDLEDMVESVTCLLPVLLGVSQGGVLLWDELHGEYRPASICGADEATQRRFAETRLPIGRWGALDAVHIGQIALPTLQPPPWLAHPAKSDNPLHLCPLLFDGSPRGILFRYDPAPPEQLQTEQDYLHASDLRYLRQELIQDLATQLAQGIERTLLRRAQQEEAWVNTALLQVADAVNSLIDLNEILGLVVRFVPMLVGVRSSVVLVWDEETEFFHPAASYGLSEMGTGLLRTLALTGEEFRSLTTEAVLPAELLHKEMSHYVLKVPHWLEQVMGTAEARALPLHAQARFVGVMLVGLATADQLSDRRLSILFGIAQQAATAVVNNQLYAEAAKRDKLEQEITIARKIQASLIPHGSPTIRNCVVASLWQAARQVSGDFYDFVPLKDDEWGIIIADVADKGVPAALFMAVSRTILRAVVNNRNDPADVLRRANELILGDSDSDLFVTVFLAIWNPNTQVLRYASGGHNPPILFHADGRISELYARGMALGVVNTAAYETRRVQLEPDDVVLFYTDGVSEAIDLDMDEFGLERLRQVVAQNRYLAVEQIVEQITAAVHDHVGAAAQFDDITFMVLKCVPEQTWEMPLQIGKPQGVRQHA